MMPMEAYRHGDSSVLRMDPPGTSSRQVVLGDGLDLDAVAADHRDGVLTVTIPVAEQVKPRRIQIGRSAGDDDPKAISEADVTTSGDRAPSTPGAAS
jgi:HSP20 family protein